MTVLISLAAAARNLPWQVWAVAAILIAVGLYGCDQRSQGESGARTEIQQSNDRSRGLADEAARTAENCIGRWDRSRGLCVPDDGSGR